MERAQSPKTSMPHSEPRIQCSNPNCVASNKLEARCCHRCKTPITKRYLWAMSEVIDPTRVKELIGNRYFALTERVFLDTKPGIQPQTPEEVPPQIIAYLQLFTCYPHIPQIYGQIDTTDVWLLDYGTVPITSEGRLKYAQLIPELTSLWSRATAFQQLNWLWQIAKLWRPLTKKKVASSLLIPELIRLNGQFIQILQLQPDLDRRPQLKHLGELWLQWSEYAKPNIQELLTQLANRIASGNITKSDRVVAILDRAMAICRRSREYSYQVYAISDSGPNRANNEDAAYPVHSSPLNIAQPENSLTIVCDGVGGHEGGEIAATETINYLRDRIAQLSFKESENNTLRILKQLNQYISESNDVISQRNDSEQRHERQRMGTTLVMTLAHGHEIYLAHIGDSRIYWITPNSCHQLTIDDDLASREVRLGYAVYRDSLQYPSAGALIQALGMRDSTALHPNLQRHTIEDDCILLLCTDGLSDFDRVEQHWRHTVLPVLQGKQDLVTAVKNLIKIANERNGHDNVTVALVHCRVTSKPELETATIAWSEVELAREDSGLGSDVEPDTTDLPITETPETDIPEFYRANQSAHRTSQSGWLKYLVLILIVSIVIGSGFYLFLQKRIDDRDDSQKVIPDSESVITSPE